MKDAVTVFLVHARVNVEARVAQIRDFLGQELDTLNFVYLVPFLAF